jgi:hypothetical protein
MLQCSNGANMGVDMPTVKAILCNAQKILRRNKIRGFTAL